MAPMGVLSMDGTARMMFLFYFNGDIAKSI